MDGRTYFIVYQASSLALTLSDEDDTSVLGYELNGKDNQKWVASRDDNYFWTFKNVANGKFLSIAGEPGPGVKLVGADSPTQWQITPELGASTFSILIPDSSLIVGLPDNGDVPSGTPVELLDGLFQAWKFEET